MSIKRSKISKLTEKVDIFWLFRSNLNNFDIKSISFDRIQTFGLIFEPLWFCPKDSDSDDEFGLKKSQLKFDSIMI